MSVNTGGADQLVIEKLEARVMDLQDFCIWLTGCGYDFTQHKYFIKQRDRLLKDYEIGPFNESPEPPE